MLPAGRVGFVLHHQWRRGCQTLARAGHKRPAEGSQAALQAQNGIEGPSHVLEVRDGFTQAFAFGRNGEPRSIELPPSVPFSIIDCYVKPYACCRHIQPAVEALIELMNDNKLSDDVLRRQSRHLQHVAV